jgi:pimeloyl-ACP methyl ester carboxylesterase
LRVIRFDNRDVGRSSRLEGVDYELTDMAGDVVALIEALGVGPVHLVGQSMGGMIAQIVALESPESLATLALLYSAPGPSYITGRDLIEGNAAMPAPVTREDAIRRFVENQIKICGSPGYPPDREWLRELAATSLDRGYDQASADRQAKAILGDADRTDRLDSLVVPTTIVHGTSDRLIDPAASEVLHERIPGATLRLHKGMGHELPRPLWPALVDQIVTNTERAR